MLNPVKLMGETYKNNNYCSVMKLTFVFSLNHVSTMAATQVEDNKIQNKIKAVRRAS